MSDKKYWAKEEARMAMVAAMESYREAAEDFDEENVIDEIQNALDEAGFDNFQISDQPPELKLSAALEQLRNQVILMLTETDTHAHIGNSAKQVTDGLYYKDLWDMVKRTPQQSLVHIEDAAIKNKKLDKPAKVGVGVFYEGVKWSMVIAAAERQYVYHMANKVNNDE